MEPMSSEVLDRRADPETPPDLTAEELAELNAAAAGQDGDEVIPAEVFLPSIGIPWPPPG